MVHMDGIMREPEGRDCTKIEKELYSQSRLLRGIARAEHCLLTMPNLADALDSGLSALGAELEVDVISILQNFNQNDGPAFGRIYEWPTAQPSMELEKHSSTRYPYDISGNAMWYDMLSQGKTIFALTRELLEREKPCIESQGIVSMLLVPIFVGDKFWGFISFENLRNERAWSDNEKSGLMVMAGSLGGALERRAAEKALKYNGEHFRRLIEKALDIITVVDSQGKITYTTPSNEWTMGFSPSEMIGKDAAEYIHPDDRQPLKEAMDSVLESPGASMPMEVRIRRRDGTYCYLETIGTSFIDENGMKGVVINSRDVTTRRMAEQALAEEKELLAVTLDSVGEAVVTVDMEGRIVLFNRSAEELTGWKSEEAVSKPIGDVLYMIDQNTGERYEDPTAKALKPRAGREKGSHTVLVSRDGTRKIIADTGAPVRDREGKTIGSVIALRDITERLAMEEELFRMNKIESVGVLAGGIAHDFNNILTIVMGNLSLAMMYQKAGNSQKSMERLMDVEKACIQARGLTSQLLTFSKGGSPVVKTVSIAQLVKDTAAFALRGSNVGLNFTIEDGLWPAEIDSSQISQVINNLVINAKQAMPDGGIITIHAENTWVAGDEALPLIVGRYIRLSVKDTGSGIPEKDLPRVFDPYFTTKPEGHGLGLTICYTIVKKHNGHITVNSREGMGTVFSIYLPASGEEAKEELTGENTVVQGSGRILIVEDDKEVRSTIEGMLVQLGYEAECTAEGAAAVYAYCNSKKEGQPFDAVIMDLTICGGMGGKEAAGRILKMDPNARIIVSSGYSNDPVMSDYREYGFVNIAAKPYKIEELSRILHDVING